MICADGAIRPCCNSLRILKSPTSFDSENVWNTDETVNLRTEMLTGELDAFCTNCKSRNVAAPEEVISKSYTEHAIFCENSSDASIPATTGGSLRFAALSFWQGASVNFEDGRRPERSDRLTLAVSHNATADLPEFYFLRGCDNEILTSARGVPVDALNTDVIFEAKPLQFETTANLSLIAQFKGGELREIPWRIDTIRMTDNALYLGDQKYPIVSDRQAPLGVRGYFDECSIVWNVLRCRGWAYDQVREVAPDRFVLFSRKKFIAISSPRGERYDVGKEMSASRAVRSGFFFNIELENSFDIEEYDQIQVVALFAKPYYTHIVGITRAGPHSTPGRQEFSLVTEMGSGYAGNWAKNWIRWAHGLLLRFPSRWLTRSL